MKFCKWCDGRCSEGNGIFSIRNLFCPIYIKQSDYIDAAEFEARTADKLTYIGFNYCEVSEEEDCENCGPSKRGLTCRWCRLKIARLWAEDEMLHGHKNA